MNGRKKKKEREREQKRNELRTWEDANAKSLESDPP
jgi:hypothetical protein